MSVGFKLAGLIFGLAVLIVIFLLFLSSPLLKSFGIEPLFMLDLKIEVSSLISALAVLVLVWERLRESVQKSLESVNENVLTNLRHRLEHNERLFGLGKNQIEKDIDYLRRYGRFLGVIRLHPIEQKRIDRFITLLEPFEENIKQIRELTEKEVAGVRLEQILRKLGFAPLIPSQMTAEEEEKYTKAAQKLQNEHPELIDNTKKSFEELKTVRKEIYENLDNFVKENHLPILTHWTVPKS